MLMMMLMMKVMLMLHLVLVLTRGCFLWCVMMWARMSMRMVGVMVVMCGSTLRVRVLESV